MSIVHEFYWAFKQSIRFFFIAISGIGSWRWRIKREFLSRQGGSLDPSIRIVAFDHFEWNVLIFTSIVRACASASFCRWLHVVDATFSLKAAPDWTAMLKIDVDIPHKQEGCRHPKFSASAPVDASIPHVSTDYRYQFICTGIQSGCAFRLWTRQWSLLAVRALDYRCEDEKRIVELLWRHFGIVR